MSETNWVNFKEIKDKISLEKILKHYLLLEKFNRKGNNLVGPCPIHKGTNQTQFHISLDKNNFNCFGDCHGGGNVIDFVCAMEGLNPNQPEDFRKAALLIKEWFPLPVGKTDEPPTTSPAPEQKPAERVKEEYHIKPPEEANPKELGQAVNQPLKFALKNLDAEHPYLLERGLTKETIQAFGLGFCSKGLMAGRVAIPIHNHVGELVAYVGRWPGEPPEGEPKYKFPLGFHKALVLFNFHLAKELAQVQELILVEGFFDCLLVWQAGFKNVAALMGSRMSEDQEKLIVEVMRPSGKVSLMFDEDEAGWACRSEVLERLVSQVYVKVIRLGNEGLQPDQLTEAEIKKLLS